MVSKYAWIRISLLSFVCVGIASAAETSDLSVRELQDRPNVLFIIMDDLNDSVEGLGGHPQAQTPHMDKLIDRGVRFTSAHCNYAMCSQSRTSLMTGLYPSTTGAFGFVQSGNFRRYPELKNTVTLTQYMAQNGYNVYGTGKVYHGGGDSEWNRENIEFGHHKDFGPWPWDGKSKGKLPHPAMAGEFNWTETFGPLSNVPEYKPDPAKGVPGYKGWYYRGKPFRYVNEDDRDLMTDERSAQWAKAVLEQTHEKPFFMAVGFMRPHSPLYAPKKYFDRMPPAEAIELPPYLENDLEDCAKVLWDPPSEGRGGAATRFGHHKFLTYKSAGLWREWIRAYLANVAFVDDQVGTVLDALEQSPYADNTIVILTSDHGWHMGEKDWIFKHTLWEEATKVPFIVVDPRNGVHNRECKKPASLVDIYPTVVDYTGLPSEPNRYGNRLPLDGFSLKPLVDNPEKGAWEGPDVALVAIAPNETHNQKELLVADPKQQHYAVRSERWRYILCSNGEEELYDHESDPQEWTNLAAHPEHKAVKQKLNTELQKLLAGKQKLPLVAAPNNKE